MLMLKVDYRGTACQVPTDLVFSQTELHTIDDYTAGSDISPVWRGKGTFLPRKSLQNKIYENVFVFMGDLRLGGMPVPRAGLFCRVNRPCGCTSTAVSVADAQGQDHCFILSSLLHTAY